MKYRIRMVLEFETETEMLQFKDTASNLYQAVRTINKAKTNESEFLLEFEYQQANESWTRIR